MADQSVELAAYDPTWQARFAEQQMRLATILKPCLVGEIEHIGSTSVAGLRSNPDFSYRVGFWAAPGHRTAEHVKRMVVVV